VEIVTGAELLPPETEHERAVKQRNRVPAEERLACRVSPRGDVCIRASYW
jgi:ferredoxin